MTSTRPPLALSPSILAAELINLKSVLPTLEAAGTDFLHIDVMDGHFVPQLSFGEQITAEIGKSSSIPLDVHLMVENPEFEVPKYYAMKPAHIVFHIEATRFPLRLLNEIKKQGIKAGVSLNPITPASAIIPLLDALDLVLVMSVDPGFYGQPFIPYSLEKVKQIRALAPDHNKLKISIDGGVNVQNIGSLYQAGVDMAVAGSAVFKGDISANIKAIKENAR